MIVGVVSANREAKIRFMVRGPNGQEQEVEATVDTGFNGSLTLPTSVVNALGLAWREFRRAMLANGTTEIFYVYDVTVLWDNQARSSPVYAIDTDPLVGMSLLYGSELHIQVADGGRVTIEPLSP